MNSFESSADNSLLHASPLLQKSFKYKPHSYGEGWTNPMLIQKCWDEAQDNSLRYFSGTSSVPRQTTCVYLFV